MSTMSELEVFNRLKAELMSWPGVTSQPHRFGGTEFRVNSREMGHVHGGRFADLPFPMNVRNQLVKDGRALPHHVLPNSGWITFLINEETDITFLISLFRVQYERLTAPRSKMG
jgi:luciferase-like monooxygenase